MTFGSWNVRGLYRTVPMEIVASEFAKYNLDIMRVQKVICENGGSQPEDYTGFFVHKGIRSAIKEGKIS
jgi:hypothetical protein